MCATPLGTLRFVFFAPDFLAGLAMADALQEQGGNRGTELEVVLVTPVEMTTSRQERNEPGGREGA
jgi:hypothetical protein